MNLFDDQSNEDFAFDDNSQIPEKYLERFKEADKDAIIKEKFKTDAYVEHLTRQMDAMREDFTKLSDEYKAGASLKELVDQLSQQRLASNEEPEVNGEEKPELDLTKIEDLVARKLEEKETLAKETTNYNQVKAKLTERFGKNYKDVLDEQKELLGLSDDYVNQIARKSPQAFFRLMGLDEQPKSDNTFQAPMRTQRNDGFAPQLPQKRTWSYYEKLRKESPKLYYEPRTQVQMHKDAQELGDAFKDGNWR